MKSTPLKNYNVFEKNYEHFTLDFINNSSYFKQYGTFTHPQSESHSECDAESENYKFDFKLFISQGEAKLRHKYSDKIEFNENGELKSITHYAIDPNENLTYYDLSNLLPYYNLNDLEKIYNNSYVFQNTEEKKEISHFVNKILLTNKNILFVIPQIFFLENKSIEEIVENLNNSFKTIFCFRTNTIQKDSYLSFFITDYDKNTESVKYVLDKNKKCKDTIESKIKAKFILLKYNNGNLKLLDIIDTKVSSFYHRFDKFSIFTN